MGGCSEAGLCGESGAAAMLNVKEREPWGSPAPGLPGSAATAGLSCDGSSPSSMAPAVAAGGDLMLACAWGEVRWAGLGWWASGFRSRQAGAPGASQGL